MSSPQGTADRPLRVMSALVIVRTVDETVLPLLAKEGLAVEMVWDPTVALMERVARGETADAIVAIDGAMDRLAAEGRLDPASRRPVARAAFGLGVARGAPQPDIATAEALKQSLLAARAVAWSRAGASGIYFERLIDRLGIGDAVRARGVVIPAGFTGEVVVRGDADIAIQQISELMSVDGIDLVGPMPPEVQEPTDFSAAAFAGPGVDAARAARFIEVLTGPQAREALVRHGLEPR